MQEGQRAGTVKAGQAMSTVPLPAWLFLDIPKATSAVWPRSLNLLHQLVKSRVAGK